MWKPQESELLLTLQRRVRKRKETIHWVTLCNKGSQSSKYLAWSVALRQPPGFRLDDPNGPLCTLIYLNLSRPFINSWSRRSRTFIGYQRKKHRNSGTTRNRTLNGALDGLPLTDSQGEQRIPYFT